MVDNNTRLMTKPYRILIVDDHPVVREGLRALLGAQAEFQVCGETGTVAEALEIIRAEAPDAVIVDMLLNQESGLDLIREIKTLDPDIRILAHSMHEDQHYAERALAAGA